MGIVPRKIQNKIGIAFLQHGKASGNFLTEGLLAPIPPHTGFPIFPGLAALWFRM
jgi:hypothetical protein